MFFARSPSTSKGVVLGLAAVLAVSFFASTASATHETSSPIRIDSLTAEVSITHHYARTTVTEVVTNPSSAAWEFTALLADPEPAFITRFALETDGLVYESRIEGADAARSSYNASLASHQPSALVESRGLTTYQISFNIPANTTVTVHLAYEQMILRSAGEYRYRFPLVASSGGKTIGALDLQGTVTGNNLIEKASANLGTLVRDQPSSLAFSHRSSHLVPASDFVLVWTETYPAGAGTVITHDGVQGATFVHVFSPDSAGLSNRPLPKDIVFVLDTSGSMHQAIAQVKDAMSSILFDLRPADRFDIIGFASISTSWKPSLVYADTDNVNAAIDWVNHLAPHGGTDIDRALETGLLKLQRDPSRAPALILMTDGYATAGVKEGLALRANLAQRNTMGASVYALAFGSCPELKLLQAIAGENGGEARLIYVGSDASAQIRGFYETIRTPLMRDITVSYPDGGESASPAYFPRAFAGADLVVVGRLKPHAAQLAVEIRGTGSGGPIVINGTFDVTAAEAGPFVERAWAYARVQALHNPAVLGDAHAKAEIIQLALQYRFVTDWTSLVVVLPPILEAMPGLSRADLRIATSSASPVPTPTSDGNYSGSTPPKPTAGPQAFAAVVALGAVAFAASRRHRR